jgi:hypothetical protein
VISQPQWPTSLKYATIYNQATRIATGIHRSLSACSTALPPENALNILIAEPDERYSLDDTPSEDEEEILVRLVQSEDE